MEDSLGEEEDEVGEGEAGGSRLYVGNLPYSMTASQLSEVFQEAGAVDNVEVRFFLYGHPGSNFEKIQVLLYFLELVCAGLWIVIACSILLWIVICAVLCSA